MSLTRIPTPQTGLLNRIQILGRACFGALLTVVALQAVAQTDFPNKPIRLIVPFTPGGVTDTSGRLIAEQLSKRLGQQVVVDNKPGASGNIGSQMVAAAEPDGYTLLLGFDGTLVINPHVFPRIGFDPVKDFAPVGKIGDAILILVTHPQAKTKTLKDVIAQSKSDANGLSYGTSGTGSTPHIAGELFKLRTGANLVHVPYKGGGQAMTDLLGGICPWSTPPSLAPSRMSKRASYIRLRFPVDSEPLRCRMCRPSWKVACLISRLLPGLGCWPLPKRPKWCLID